jgi:hypothetical protein
MNEHSCSRHNNGRTHHLCNVAALQFAAHERLLSIPFVLAWQLVDIESCEVS